MQTLAKYLFGLLLFLFASLINEEPEKEKLAEKCTQQKTEINYVCVQSKELQDYI